MPHLAFLEAFICNRCWTRLFKPTRRKRIGLQSTTSFHSSSQLRNVAESGLQHGPPASAAPRTSEKPPHKRNGADHPRSQGWRALLQNKTLGEAASILVLRDTERKKGARRREEEQQQEQSYTDVNPESLLESLEGQKIDPEQSEVNSSIDELKPVAQKHGDLRSPTIPQKQYDKALEQLAERFNQMQLARYITHASEEQDLPREAEQDHRTLARQWRPPNGVNGKRHAGLRGKKGLADSIIRTVWGFEVDEEVNGQGTLEIRLDHKRVALALSDEKSSALHNLEESKGIKIEVVEAKRLVKITGPKYVSFETIADVEAVLQEPYEQMIGLGTYSAILGQDDLRKGGISRRMIDQIAASVGCQVTLKGKNMMSVRGPEQQATERFQRLLLAQFDLPLRTKDSVLSGLPLRTELGFIVVEPQVHNTPSETPIDPHGRFTLSFRIAEGDMGKPKQLPELQRLPPALMSDVFDILKPPATLGLSLAKEPLSKGTSMTRTTIWHSQPSTEFTTYYAHLLHRTKPGAVIHPIQTKDLVRQVKLSPRTSPTASGLPYVIQQLTLENSLPIKTTASRLRIELIPSPFTYNASALRGMPTVAVDLLLQSRDRQISIDSVQATLGTRGAHAMLGHLGLDMSIKRREYLNLSDPEAEPNLQAFVNSMAASYATSRSDNLFVPLNLKLRVPSYTLIPGALRKLPELVEQAKAQEEVEVDYFAVSAQHQSDVVLDYKGQELIYRRSKDVETGKVEEGVLLRNLSDNEGTEQDSEQASKAAPDPTTDPTASATQSCSSLHDFLETSQDMLCRLNIGLGKVRRMDDVLRKTEREAREQEDQQAQKAGVESDLREWGIEERPKSLLEDEGFSSRVKGAKGGIKVVLDPE